MREIIHHKGNGLNAEISIIADDRDENGGSHEYEIRIPHVDMTTQYNATDLFNEINFQKGPLKEVGLNGISDEALIAIVIDRLEGFQTGPFRNRYNAIAITKLEEALLWLTKRTTDRVNRGVEGRSVV